MKLGRNESKAYNQACIFLYLFEQSILLLNPLILTIYGDLNIPAIKKKLMCLPYLLCTLCPCPPRTQILGHPNKGNKNYF